jgi:DGQHR domain-containing protein
MPDQFPGLSLQSDPAILIGVLPGRWLLDRTTPSWRIADPKRGFQRQVSEKRARQIAANVLDQGRTFPNAIVLATNSTSFKVGRGFLTLSSRIRFLVVDGQHRLWAQGFSENEAGYCCLIHFGLSEEQMAELFIEINDNQKRVPSSLRWDLVRLVKPDDDPHGVRATELVFELASRRRSPLFQRIDLTGEQKEISLKQGSLAPDIKLLVSKRDSPLHDEGFDVQFETLSAYFAAIRNRDADGWDDTTSPLYKPRVLRSLLRLLPDLIARSKKDLQNITASDFARWLSRIRLDTLDPVEIRGQQGAAGIKAIYDTIHAQVFEE